MCLGNIKAVGRGTRDRAGTRMPTHERNPRPRFNVEACMEKQEIKWEEVAHHYSRSKISISSGSEVHDVSELSIYPHGILIEFGRGGFVFTWEEHKPILCAVEDMTEAEAMELWNSVPGRVAFDESLYSPYGSPLRMYSTKADFWLPNEFHWLTQRGFDVFGLIESGQAIRKEAQPAAGV